MSVCNIIDDHQHKILTFEPRKVFYDFRSLEIGNRQMSDVNME
jgi:hypothetical protein